MNRSLLVFIGAAAFAVATLPCQAAPTDARPDSRAVLERIAGALSVDFAPRRQLAALASDDENQADESVSNSGERRPSGSPLPMGVSLGMIIGGIFLIVKRMTGWVSRRSLKAGREYDAKVKSSEAPWSDRGLKSSGFNEGSVDRAIADALARRSGG